MVEATVPDGLANRNVPINTQRRPSASAPYVPERRWRVVLAFWLGCLSTTAIFFVAQGWQVVLHPAALTYLIGIAVVVTTYVMLFGVPAYYALVRILRPGPHGRRTWLAYSATAFAAGYPYFTILAITTPAEWQSWLAGMLASSANATIGYCMIELRMPWRWPWRTEIAGR